MTKKAKDVELFPGFEARKRLIAIQEAIRHLRLAREHLAVADAPRTLERVRLALTSAGGAERHAYGRTITHRMAPAPAANGMLPAHLSIDDGASWIDGFVVSDRDNWNGWANPFFDRDQLPALVEHWNQTNTNMDGGLWLELVSGDLVMVDRDLGRSTVLAPEDAGLWYLGHGYCWHNSRVHG